MGHALSRSGRSNRLVSRCCSQDRVRPLLAESGQSSAFTGWIPPAPCLTVPIPPAPPVLSCALRCHRRCAARAHPSRSGRWGIRPCSRGRQTVADIGVPRGTPAFKNVSCSRPCGLGWSAKSLLKPWMVVTEGREGLLIATSRPVRQRAECPFRRVVLHPVGGLIGCFRPIANSLCSGGTIRYLTGVSS